jgi:acetyltransferase-like isoleucine patch superfamily enzyme
MLIQKPRIPFRDIVLFGLLPSFLKKAVYRLKGFRIGKGVSIGFGSVLCGEEVSVGRNTRIGFLSIIRGKRISIGSHVSIGSTVFIDTPVIEIGDGTKINEQVFVGGLQFPDSLFRVGRNCQIMQLSFINPARSVVIGDDTGIGGHCLLFGHTSWLSCFEGYPVEFKPIEIGNSVSIAWGAFLLPGTIIGDGAVIGANSMVGRTVPPKCLAIGYPARVVSKYPDFPVEVSADEKVKMLKAIVDEMIHVFQASGLTCTVAEGIFNFFHDERCWFRKRHRHWVMQVVYEPFDGEPAPKLENGINVLLSLNLIPQAVRKKLNAKGTLWIDLAAKEQADISEDFGDEVLLFLRRYGVRFNRVP